MSSYERGFKLSLSHENKVNIIEAFSRASRYLDGLLLIDSEFIGQIIDTSYPKELQLKN